MAQITTPLQNAKAPLDPKTAHNLRALRTALNCLYCDTGIIDLRTQISPELFNALEVVADEVPLPWTDYRLKPPYLETLTEETDYNPLVCRD
jgi:hypothetical protein